MLVALLLGGFLGSLPARSAAADAAPPPAPSPVVLVRSARADGVVSQGSGVAIGADLVITARHVLECGVLDTVDRGDGVQRPARPLRSLPGLDLVLLSVPALDAAPLALAGLPGSRQTLWVEGARTALASAGLRFADGWSLGLAAPRVPGDSGGPVRDGAGALVGVVVEAGLGGYGEGQSIAAGPAALTSLLSGSQTSRACSPAERSLTERLRGARAGRVEPVRPPQTDRRPGVVSTLGRAWVRSAVSRGAQARAASWLARSIGLQGPDRRRSVDLACVLLLAQDWEAAEREIVALGEDAESGALIRAYAGLRSPRGAAAVAVADLLVDRWGPLPHLVAARCRARGLHGDAEGARRDCLAALGPGPEASSPVAILPVLHDLAALDLDAGDAAAALGWLDLAVEQTPLPALLLARAFARLVDGRERRGALRDIDRALALVDVDEARYLRALALALLGERDAALREIAHREARRLEEQDSSLAAQWEALSAALRRGELPGGVNAQGELAWPRPADTGEESPAP